VVDEPSIVALDVHTGKVVAIGHQARQMHEKTNPRWPAPVSVKKFP